MSTHLKKNNPRFSDALQVKQYNAPLTPPYKSSWAGAAVGQCQQFTQITGVIWLAMTFGVSGFGVTDFKTEVNCLSSE